MGRPLNKRYFGEETDNVIITGHVGSSNAETCFLVSQRGTNKFRITNGSTSRICRIVNKASNTLAAGEMIITGRTTPAGSDIRIRKMFNRTCTDWNSNRYSWSLDSDSTTTYLSLTAI